MNRFILPFDLRLPLLWQLLATFLFLSLTACNTINTTEDSGTTEVTVLFDMTDPMLLTPDYAMLQRLFNFEEYPDRAVSFRASTISDMQLNPSFEAHLPAGRDSELHNELDDISFRNTAIREFNSRVKTILSELKDTARNAAGCDYSECMSVIARALGALSQSKAERRLLFCYTDLAENGAINLCTSASKYGWTIKDTASIARRLEKLASLPAVLSGIEVYLLYHPKSREDDQRYNVLSHAYRNLLEARGARVTVSATNEIYLP